MAITALINLSAGTDVVLNGVKKSCRSEISA
jgi:hypothetical protein